jgi:hypothetical protein
VPLSLTLLRGILGLLCVLFAHFLGRAVQRRLGRGDRKAPLITWLLRTAVTAAGVVWRSGLDGVSWIVFGAAAISAGLGFYTESRPKHHEDVTKQMFPDN